MYLHKAASPPTHKTTSKRAAPKPKKSKYRKKFKAILNITEHLNTSIFFAQYKLYSLHTVVENESY